MPFKRLVTRKKQPEGPGRSSDANGKSIRSLGELSELEGDTPAKQRRTTRSATTTKPAAPAKPTGRSQAEAKEANQRRCRRLSKTLKQVGRTVRLDIRIRRLSKILKTVRQDRVQESG